MTSAGCLRACFGLLSLCCQFTFDFKFPVFPEPGPPYKEHSAPPGMGISPKAFRYREGAPHLVPTVKNGARVLRKLEHFDKAKGFISAEERVAVFNPARRDRLAVISNPKLTRAGSKFSLKFSPHRLVQSSASDTQECSPEHRSPSQERDADSGETCQMAFLQFF